MPEEIVSNVLRAYGLDVELIHKPTSGYRNQSYPVLLKNGQTVNLILYKNEPDIEQTIQNANQVGDFLAENGFFSRRTYDKRVLKLTDGRQKRYVGLYKYLPGNTIPWEAYTQDHIKQLGKAMSYMHAVLRNYDLVSSTFPTVTAQLLADLRSMEKYFSDAGVQAAAKRKLGIDLTGLDIKRFNAILQAGKDLPNQQLLHMDFVRGNVLFMEDPGLSVSGVLDFEKVAIGHRLFDISRTLAFLLVDCKYKTVEKVRKYFLVSGYNKRGATSFSDLNIALRSGNYSLLEELVSYFLLYDFYKFLKHNPYESLADNEHYVRTRNMLLKQASLNLTSTGIVNKSVKI